MQTSQAIDAIDLEIARVDAVLAQAEFIAKTKADLAGVRERCKTLHGFILEAWHVLEPGRKFVDGPHLHVMCAVLEAITFGKFLKLGWLNRAIFNVPPGAMKSLLISVIWQAWVWGPCGMPEKRFLSTSYNEGNVTRDTRKTRDLVMSEWFQMLWGPNSGVPKHVEIVRSGETSFANTATGSREGRSYGSLTGIRADFVTVDDPQSTEMAESDPEQATTERITKESLMSRVNDAATSAIVVVAQRLRENDVSGMLLAMKIGFVHVMLPMYFEVENRFEIKELGIRDSRVREGDLLFPERWNQATLDIEAIPLAAHGVATQWQQRPTPRGGGMFKRVNFLVKPVLPAGSWRWVRAWDFAASVPKPGKKPDWTVGLRVGRHVETKRFWIVKCLRFQKSAGQVHFAVKNTADLDGIGVTVRIPQDPGQAGKDQAESYITELAGYNVIAKPISGDKTVRANAAANQSEAGNICLLATGDADVDAWIEPFLQELEKFPRGNHDDQVDALSDAINELALGGSPYEMTDASIG